MNFFNQYRDLFEVGNVPVIPNRRLKLDNDLFIDKPYISTIKQQYSLNSKLRQLKKDYSEFENQINQIEELQSIQQRSGSRRKQTYNNNSNDNSGRLLQHRNRNDYAHKKNSSNIFSHYQEDKNQYLDDKRRNQLTYQNSVPNNKSSSIPIRMNQKKYPQVNQKQNHLKNQRNNQYMQQSQKFSPDRQHLQNLRRQNQQNTSRFMKNQNLLKTKLQHEQNSNILKQSQINHVFNWKLQKLSSAFDKNQNISTSSPVPKYKIENSSLQSRENQRSFGGNNKNFMIRAKSNNQIKPNERNKIVPQQKQHNTINRNSNAMERRRIATQNIDQRREKLRDVIKSYF